MSAKPNILTMARTAVFNHSAPFRAHWGEASQNDDGVVTFSALPSSLSTLSVEPEFKRRWMGGTCAMNIIVSQPCSDTQRTTISFKGGRGGHFAGKSAGKFSAALLTALNADSELKQTLLKIDLETLVIKIQDNSATIVLTPYGGGLVYLVIPPMKSIIPLPEDQTDSLAWALEKLAVHIESVEK